MIDTSLALEECVSIESKEFCRHLLQVVLTTRMLDEKSQTLAKQNQGGTFHLSSMGHEIIGGVAGILLQKGVDWGLPYYRDRGFAVGVGCDLVELIGATIARDTQHHSSGRMMPEHYSDRQLRIPCQSSCVGSQFLQAVGIAKGIVLRDTREVVYVSGGDGATSQGDFHEALNFAALHRLPVIFVIQDNEWAISVSKSEQTAGLCISHIARGYSGLDVQVVDGTDYAMTAKAVLYAVHRGREQKGPSLVVAKVPRIGPHSSSDNPTKYKSCSDIETDRNRDPVVVLQQSLIEEGKISTEEIESIRSAVIGAIEQATDRALALPHPDPHTLTDALFVSVSSEVFCEKGVGESVVMVDAINLALREEMERDPGVVIFGQDVAHGKGGVFGATRDLTQLFGANRCFNTPLAESTIMGLALGLSLDGVHKPVAEIQFADYLWTGFNQLINEISSYHYRSHGEWHLPLVIRVPCGAYIQGGPYHSQNIEGFLAHIPGLKIVIPSNAYDAKALLKSAIRDPNPVIFFEHKAIYRQKRFVSSPLAGRESLLPLGKAAVVKDGKDITLVCWGYHVMLGYDVANELEKEGLSVEVIDLRSICPLDEETLLLSLRKTGKMLILHEAAKTGGFGGEVAALMVEKAFDYLDAPIRRLAGSNCPVSYSKILEEATLPSRESLRKELLALSLY